MKKICILAVPLTQPIVPPLKATFGSMKGIKIEKLTDEIIEDLSDSYSEQLIAEMYGAAQDIVDRNGKDAEYYLVCGGNAGINVIAYDSLMNALDSGDEGAPISLLIWNRENRNYVCFDLAGKMFRSAESAEPIEKPKIGLAET